MVRVEGCCCCNLRTAGLVIGWLGIVLLVLGFIGTVKDIVTDTDNSLESDVLNRNAKDRRQQNITTLIVTSIDLLISSLLVHGIINNKHVLLLPWLILRGIGLLLVIPLAVFIIFLSQLIPESGVFLLVVIFGIIVGIWAWTWIVIYSLYHEIRDAKRRPQHQMPPPSYQNQAHYQSQYSP